MKNTILASFFALFAAGGAFAQTLNGSVGVEITENAAGKYVAETTLGFGASVNTGAGLAFGGFTFESVDGSDLSIDQWQLGLSFGNTVVSLGKQGDVFVAGRMNTVGEGTLTLPVDDGESIILSHGAASVLIGFTDITTDITDLRNVQLSYTANLGAVDLTGAIDHNLSTNENTLGFAGNYFVNENLGVGAVATYTVDGEVFGYEAYTSYNFATVFANGNNTDALQNIGVGLARNFNNIDVYAEAEYNIDSKDTRVAIGAALNF
jgi:hypothetical protein